MTASNTSGERHVPYSVVEAYALDGLSGSFAVEGTPAGRIQLSPADRVITLLVQATDNVAGPDLHGLANVDYDLEEEAGVMWHRLDVAYAENLAEVYPVLCAIADRVQLKQETFASAVRAALTGLQEILAGRGGLTPEKQVGLFGELTVLLSLALETSAAEAVEAWRGPDREEHDFGLANCDLEVKTTASEKRSHWINSLTQLSPSPGRMLFLLSLQLTAAGGEPGLSLAELVDTATGFPGMPTEKLSNVLESSGYYARHADLYVTRWRLRSAPAFYLVDEQFPALTTNRVFAVIPKGERIEDVRYRIGLDGLTDREPLFPVEIAGLST
jgi:hypothetical protein